MEEDKTLRLETEESEDKTLLDNEEEITLIDKESEGTAVTPRWARGDVIEGLYRIENIVKGGMGVIYFIEHLKWGVKLVVKSPREEFLQKEDKKRFIREAETWVELGKHPNIATAFYVKEIQDIPRIFIEYADDGSLTEKIKNKLKLTEATDMAIQFCEGIIHAHSRGLVHRDIKPDNVLLMKDGTVKITDFGLVKTNIETDETIKIEKPPSLKPQEWKTIHTGSSMGTPPYMPPEQWTAAEKADKRSDVYSFGVMLFEMLCGRRPFERDPENTQPAHIAYQIMHRFNPPPAPSAYCPHIPEKLNNLILKCLEKNPENRYGTFEEIIDSLLMIYRDITGTDYDRKRPGEVELKTEDLNNRALSYLDLGKKEEAKSLLEKAVKLDPHSISANINLILLLMDEKLGSYENILLLFKSLKEGNPQHPLPCYYEAIFHMEMGNPTFALSSISKALEMEPENIMFKELNELIRNSPRMRVYGGEEGKITGVDFLLGDKIIISYSDSTIELKDIKDGKSIKKFSSPETYMKCEIYDLTVSPHNRYIGAAYGDNTAKIWDVITGEKTGVLLGHENIVRSVDFSPDEKNFLTGSSDGTLKLWHSGSSFKNYYPIGIKLIFSTRFSPHGNIIAAGGDSHNIVLYEGHDFSFIKELKGHEGSILCLSFSKDGKYLASGSEDKTVRLWNMATKECIRTFTGHNASVESIDFSPKGDYIVSGSTDGVIKFWNINSDYCARTIEEHKASVKVKFSPDGNSILSGSKDKTLRYIPFFVKGYRVFPSGYRREYIIVKPRTVSESVQDAETFKILVYQGEEALKKGELREAHDLFRRALSVPGYGKDGRALTGIEKSGKGSVREGVNSVWLSKIFREDEGGINSIDISHDGKILVYGGKDGFIRSRDLETGKIKTFTGHEDEIFQIKVSGSGTFILSGSKDKKIKLWDGDLEKCLKTFSKNLDFKSINLFSGSRYIAVGGGMTDSTIKVIDTENEEVLRSLEGHNSTINSISISQDGKRLLSGSEDRTVKLWNVEKGKKYLRNFTEHTFPITDCILSYDGKTAISSSKDKTIKIWDIKSGSSIKTLEGHKGEITSIDLSYDGRFIISGSSDKTIRLWSHDTGECLKVLEGHTESINDVKFSYDERYIFSAGEDKTLRIWEIDWNWNFSSGAGRTSIENNIIEETVLKPLVKEALPDDKKYLSIVEKDKINRKKILIGAGILILLLTPFLFRFYKTTTARASLHNFTGMFMIGGDGNTYNTKFPGHPQILSDTPAGYLLKNGKLGIDTIINEGLMKFKPVDPVEKGKLVTSMRLLTRFENEKDKEYIRQKATGIIIKKFLNYKEEKDKYRNDIRSGAIQFISDLKDKNALIALENLYKTEEALLTDDYIMSIINLKVHSGESLAYYEKRKQKRMESYREERLKEIMEAIDKLKN